MNLIKISRTLLVGSLLSFIIGFVLVSYPIFALGWNVMFPKTSAQLAQILSKPVGTSETQTIEPEPEPAIQLPEQDLSLPVDATIRIPKIGVATIIYEEPLEQYETALKKGVWRVPDFGIPVDNGPPIILVAHRFGYLSWSQNYRETNSFFNLPQLEEGDVIEIIWDQRKFTYQVYKSEDGVEISDYSADLILYTCRFLESDIRIFRYARLAQ